MSKRDRRMERNQGKIFCFLNGDKSRATGVPTMEAISLVLSSCKAAKANKVNLGCKGLARTISAFKNAKTKSDAGSTSRRSPKLI